MYTRIYISSHTRVTRESRELDQRCKRVWLRCFEGFVKLLVHRYRYNDFSYIFMQTFSNLKKKSSLYIVNKILRHNIPSSFSAPRVLGKKINIQIISILRAHPPTETSIFLQKILLPAPIFIFIPARKELYIYIYIHRVHSRSRYIYTYTCARARAGPE